MAVDWTTPEQLAEQVQAHWNRGRILTARVTGQCIFPLELRLRRPAPRDIANRFGAVMDWVKEVNEGSREVQGAGYELRWTEVRNRVQGSNRLPVGAIIPTEADALRLIRRSADAERFRVLADRTLTRFPVLREWLARRPITALEHEADWMKILAVLEWLVAHPRPRVYLRQLDIPGVDTKFIEARRGLLSELLDLILPKAAVERSATGARGFLRRYGFREEPPLVRFRVLDPRLRLRGLEDLSVPADEFGGLKLPVKQVFITENRVNGLAFPEQPDSIVVFGLGYGLDGLAQVRWLSDVDIHYWGDIDTHGFGILNRLRAFLPRAQSFLMDRATLMSHRELWGQEPAEKRFQGDPTNLTSEELTLFEELRQDRLGERIRLEQERVGFEYVEQRLGMNPGGLRGSG
ncbi:MAG: Wadjet anti-phage system protein JetD domain-containing protein [Rhodothermales bacterium]